MKIKFSTYLILLCCFVLTTKNKAQQVINSAGGDRQLGTSNIYIGDNLGEVFTPSYGPAANWMMTMGYLQPYYETPSGFAIDPIVNHLTCIDKNEDGFIQLNLTTSVPTYTTFYYWSPARYCPNNNCNKIDTIAPGNYSVMIISYYPNRLGAIKSDTIRRNFNVRNGEVVCTITIYHGVTANNDGKNETWQIDDIDKYPKNEVTIYNRWGFEVYKTKNYDNKNNSWPPKDELSNLPSSTYFYVIDLGDGSKLIKGWVELIKD